MTVPSSPAVPPYRVTLFFGPEARAHDPNVVYCVFNVKKRSWKGGMQCVVEMAQARISRCKHILRVESWLRHALRHLPREDYDAYFQRGQELCLRYLCETKLLVAIRNGLRQDTTLLPHDELARELDHAVRQTGDDLKAALLAELDVPPREEGGRATRTRRGDGVPVDEGRDGTARPSRA